MNLTFDRVGSIFFALIGALFIAESRNISTSAYGSEVGPNLFPLGLGIILIVLSLRLLWETFQKGKHAANADSSEPIQYKRFLYMLVATLLYVTFLEGIGYVIATFLFLLITFKVMGSTSMLKSGLISLFFSLGVYLLYVYLLKGTLPGLPSWLGA